HCHLLALHIPPSILLLLFVSASGAPLSLPSFPTRRSSDLDIAKIEIVHYRFRDILGWGIRFGSRYGTVYNVRGKTGLAITLTDRSEEHTSELQSRFDLVCRLLLEKKKLHRATG